MDEYDFPLETSVNVVECRVCFDLMEQLDQANELLIELSFKHKNIAITH